MCDCIGRLLALQKKVVKKKRREANILSQSAVSTKHVVWKTTAVSPSRRIYVWLAADFILVGFPGSLKRNNAGLVNRRVFIWENLLLQQKFVVMR